jgi:hypothetical protein
MVRVLPTGEWWTPEVVRNTNPDSDQFPYAALAEMSPKEYDDQGRRKFLEQLTIPLSKFRNWCVSNSQALPVFARARLPEEHQPSVDDKIGKRVQKILQAAAEKKLKHPYLGNSRIAQLLTKNDKEKFGGYGSESIRKILSGSHEPAKKRSLPGLSVWLNRSQ